MKEQFDDARYRIVMALMNKAEKSGKSMVVHKKRMQ